MLYVFLKNKIIGADAAAPIVIELRARHPGHPVTYVVPSLQALQAIERNVVLHDALRESGRLVQVGRRRDGLFGYLESKIRGLVWLLGVAGRSFLKRTVHLHFGAFERWPFKLLFHVAPGRTLIADSAYHGFTKLMREFAQLKTDREFVLPPRHMTAALVFHEESDVGRAAASAGMPCFRMSAPHELPAWQRWLDAAAHRYFDELAKQQPALDQPWFVTLMLGYFGPHAFMRDPAGGIGLFEETLDVLCRTVPDVPIVIKPHAITNMDELGRSLAKFRRAKLVVCQLHPAMLAARSYAVVSNYYSTTQSTACRMGVPTIEYTDYSDRALAITNGGSIRPDHISHFCQRDPARFAEMLNELVVGRTEPVRLLRPVAVIDDRFFDFLATGRLH